MCKLDLDKLRIEKNIPIPTKKNTLTAFVDKMAVGDSVLIEKFVHARTLRTSIREAGYRCTCLWEKTDNAEGYRVWKREKQTPEEIAFHESEYGKYLQKKLPDCY